MFNLEEFKKGVPALTRDGEKRFFIGINPRDNGSQQLVTCTEDGTIRGYWLTGEWSYDKKMSDHDLVDMYREPKTCWISIYYGRHDFVSDGEIHETQWQADNMGKLSANFYKSVQIII